MNISKIIKNLSRLGQLPPDLRRNKVLHSLTKFLKGRKESVDYFTFYDEFYLDLKDNSNFFDMGVAEEDAYIDAIEITRQAMERKVCLLSDKYYKAGEGNFNWNRDFVYGYEWDPANPNQTTLKEGADIKNVWELCRLQFLLDYLIVLKGEDTVDGIKAEYDNIKNDFLSVLEDFIDRGSKGIIKRSSMDVGIGCVTIIELINVARSVKINFKQALFTKIREYLLQCLSFLKNNPEYSGGMRGNHYFSNVCAQIFIHLSFKSKNGEYHPDLYKLLKIFERELHYQFGQDGGDFEASLSYHFFTLEMAFNTLEYIKFNAPELNFSLSLEKVFQRISEFTLQFKGIGDIPLIGDNDSGYFLRLSPPRLNKSQNNVMPLVNERAYILDIIENMYTANRSIERIAWNLNFDFGLHTYRAKNFFLTFRCGSVGQRGKGGHAHNDQLSITLNVYGKALIVDSGTYRYSYSSKERNKYRSTESHNVLQIHGCEQNPLPDLLSDDIFWLKDKAKARIDSCGNNIIQATHVGYGGECTRIITTNEGSISVKDICKVGGVKSMRIHVHPQCEITYVSDCEVILSRENASVSISFPHKILLEDYDYCPEYGVKISGKRLYTTYEANEVSWLITIK